MSGLVSDVMDGMRGWMARSVYKFFQWSASVITLLSVAYNTSHQRYIMSQSDVERDIEWCKEFQKTVEKADLLMLIEYLTLVEMFKELAKTPSSYIEHLVSDNPQLKVRQAATYLDPQKVAKYYPHAARVMWMNPDLMDPCMFTEYLKFMLRDETEEDLKERRKNLAHHIEGLDAAVRLVYRAMGDESGLPDNSTLSSSV